MLELDNGQKLLDALWDTTAAKAVLPDSLKDSYFAARGAAPVHPENKRTYHRFHMRGKAVLKRGKSLYGTFTKDISRHGVAFLSPVALLPKERVKLRVVTTELSLEVTRCTRLEPGCFECGAKFILGREQTKQGDTTHACADLA